MNKACTICKITKPLNDFYSNGRPDGYRSDCKVCTRLRAKQKSKTNSYYQQNRNTVLRKAAERYKRNPHTYMTRSKTARWQKLGVDVDVAVDIMQNATQCAICGDTEKLVMDHCHKTRIVRGALCDACNKGIGLLKDNPKVLQKAVNYLIEQGDCNA